MLKILKIKNAHRTDPKRSKATSHACPDGKMYQTLSYSYPYTYCWPLINFCYVCSCFSCIDSAVIGSWGLFYSRWSFHPICIVILFIFSRVPVLLFWVCTVSGSLKFIMMHYENGLKYVFLCTGLCFRSNFYQCHGLLPFFAFLAVFFWGFFLWYQV